MYSFSVSGKGMRGTYAVGKNMTRLISVILVIFALGIFAGAGYLYFSDDTVQQGRWAGGGAVSVDVVDVSWQPFADRIEAIGTTRANESLVISPRVSDTVEAIHFEDGDLVEAGEVLITLNMAEQKALLSESEATLLEAQQQLERTRDLVTRGNASRATLDSRIAAVEEARSRVAAAKSRIQDRIVRAPFSGILGLRMVSLGALVSPGTPITTLDDISPIKLDFAIPEQFLSALGKGQVVIAKAAAYPELDFNGEVTTVSSRVDPVTRAVTVRAEIPNEDGYLRPGMLMTVNVINREREAIAVPEEAIIPVGREQFVFIITDENVAERRKITIGLRRPGIVEVLSGVTPGEKVVVAGMLRLRPGTPVRIMSRDLDKNRPQA